HGPELAPLFDQDVPADLVLHAHFITQRPGEDLFQARTIVIRKRLIGRNPDDELVALLLNDLVPADPGKLLQEMRKELSGDHPTAGSADQIERTALHYIQERQPSPASTVMPFPRSRVADSVPDERHPVIVEIREQDLAGLARLTRLAGASHFY